MPVGIEALKRIPYFVRLGPADLARLQTVMFEEAYAKRQVLFVEGEPCHAMYIVKSGQVRIYKASPDGKEQVLKIMGPGETFNEVPVFDDGPNPATVEALEPTVVYGIRKEEMRQLVVERPSIALSLLNAFAKRLRHLTRMVEDLSFRTVTMRLAKILVEYSDEPPPGSRKPIPLRQRLTQQQLAAMVGTAREVIGRAIKGLEAQGAIRLDRHRIVVVDRNRLKQLT